MHPFAAPGLGSRGAATRGGDRRALFSQPPFRSGNTPQLLSEARRPSIAGANDAQAAFSIRGRKASRPGRAPIARQLSCERPAGMDPGHAYRHAEKAGESGTLGRSEMSENMYPPSSPETARE